MPLEKKPGAKTGASKPPGATKPTQGAGTGFKASTTPKKPATTAVKKPAATGGDKDAAKKKETGPKVTKDDKSVKKDIDQATQLIKEVKIEEKKADEINIKLKQIADVIFDDKGNQIETTKKWPLVLDKNGNVEAFLRYRDVNFLDTFNPSNMEPDKIRVAILGSLRFGKEVVVYTHDQLTPMWSILVERMGAIYADLLKDIMSWKILEEDYYKNIVREEDGDMYSAAEFSKSQMYELNKKFKLVLLTNDEDIQAFKSDWLIVTVT